jgi:hypothetical protein
VGFSDFIFCRPILCVLFDVCFGFKSSSLFVCIVADAGVIFFVKVFVSLRRPCLKVKLFVLNLVTTLLAWLLVEMIMIFFREFFNVLHARKMLIIFTCLILLVASQNCASGIVNQNGVTTVGDRQATTFSLAPGASVCLHASVVSPSLSTPSAGKFAWSIQPSSPIATNSRLFVGQVPVSNQNFNCNNFAELGNLVIGSPAP